MITRIIHMNLVVRDFDKSLNFYLDMLGGHVVGEKKTEGGKIIARGYWAKKQSKEVGIALGLGDKAEYRAVLVRFGRDRWATMLDILQWITPASTGKSYDRLNNVGIARMALAVDNIDEIYNNLKARGVEFISPPQLADLGFPGMAPVKFVMAKDPDGIAVELVEQLT